MFASDLNTSSIVNSDYKSVVLGRYTERFLDPEYKVSREEILDIVREATVATPSAVDSQPWMFLIIDTDEGKKKMDEIMRTDDKQRCLDASFVVVPFADRQWFSQYDDLFATQMKVFPDLYNNELRDRLVPLVYEWYDELIGPDPITGIEGAYLDRSVNFQAGMAAMSMMLAFRAHGLDSGVMDSWDPQLLGEAFDIDLERYIPQVCRAVGKAKVGPHMNYRYEAEDVVNWG